MLFCGACFCGYQRSCYQEAEEGRFSVTFTSYRTTWFSALTRICFAKLARGDPLKKLLGTGRLYVDSSTFHRKELDSSFRFPF
jgi:hypothetical protein